VNQKNALSVQNAMPEKAQPSVLVRYEAMCRAIAECHRIDEVKELRDKARALEVYAQQARNTEAEDKAREIRVRAERRTGELLSELPRTTPEERGKRAHAASVSSSNDGTNSSNPERSMLHDQTCNSKQSPYAAALEVHSISRQTANRYQKLSDIPAKDFEEAVRNPSKKPTTARLIREAYSPPQPQMDKPAMWLWSRAREFEERGYAEKPPSDLFQALLPNMQKDMRRLVPVLADFYNTFKEVIR
jgi:hypothetical protein